MTSIGRGTAPPPATPSTHPTPGLVVIAVIPSRVSIPFFKFKAGTHIGLIACNGNGFGIDSPVK